MTANARHLADDPNWGTPPDLVERLRLCLGGVIDLDPFASLISNKTVQAQRIWTIADDGFAKPWVAKAMLVNPPGGMVKRAWLKLSEEILAGRLEAAAWVGFSIEQLQILADPERLGEAAEERWQRGAFHPMDFTYLIPRKRISFVKENGETGSPSHANYITFPGVDHETVVRHFGVRQGDGFKYYGRVFRGPLSIDGNINQLWDVLPP